MKLTTVLFVVAITALAAQPSCGQSVPLNELPMYGAADGKRDLAPCDQKFIEEVVQEAGSRENAAKDVISVGWAAMQAKDWRLAMKRFNQGWLLTPESADVYWGFGAALGLKGDYDAALVHFKNAKRLAPTNARLLCDFAYTYVLKAQSDHAIRAAKAESLQKANELLNEAQAADPSYELIYSDRAIAAFEAGDYQTAWAQVAEAEKLGGRSLDSRFLSDLTARFARPQ